MATTVIEKVRGAGGYSAVIDGSVEGIHQAVGVRTMVSGSAHGAKFGVMDVFGVLKDGELMTPVFVSELLD